MIGRVCVLWCVSIDFMLRALKIQAGTSLFRMGLGRLKRGIRIVFSLKSSLLPFADLFNP